MKEERQAAVEAILTAGHIPAGMELFAAGDEEQLEVIKRWIDESDIYVLLLGARYGSIEPNSKLSYTEVEYDYAASKSKPFCALVLSDKALTEKANLVSPIVETDEPAKLESFRQKVLRKISKPVDDCKDIKIHLPESIRGLEARHELLGWIRSDEGADSGALGRLAGEIAALRAERDQLEAELKEARAAGPVTPSGAPLADLNDPLEIEVFYISPQPLTTNQRHVVQTTWRGLFAAIGPELQSNPPNSRVQQHIAEILLTQNAIRYQSKSARIGRAAFETIEIQFQALGLISVPYLQSQGGGMNLYWSLTETGRAALIEFRAVRKG